MPGTGVPVVRMGSRTLGPGQPVYVIAEAGVNHNGSVDTALRLVDAAKSAGADAVKFQAFKAARLASRHAPQAAYQNGSAAATSQAEMLRTLELTPAEFARIQRHCDDTGIDFLATPFGVEDLQMLLDLRVRAIKIASPDIINRPLLEAAAESHLPILLSTGASETTEIDAAHDLLARQRKVPLVLLHCVSSYPVKLEQANLRRIATLRERYHCPTGYSDHTTETFTSQLGVAAGGCLLEKHFTLHRSQSGPDHAFSLSPADLAEYVRLARQAQMVPGTVRSDFAEAMLGTGRLDLAGEEREIRALSRCSVTAARDIPAGASVGEGMLAVKRPGTGISPWRIGEVIGRVARCDILADTAITWDMLQERLQGTGNR